MASVQLAEKPPLHHANKSPASSPATRRRKVNRQTPVPRRRQSSPGRLKRDKTLIRKDSDSNSDNDSLILEEEETETVENNNRPRTLPVRSHSNMEEGTENGNYKAKNNKQRSFERDPHSCSIHNGLGSCNCKGRRRNTVITPGISPDEVMEKETKLIVLEYLSSLSIEELTARNKTSRASSFNNTSQEDFTKGRKSVKANTVTFGETERKAILEHLAKQAQEEDLKNGKRLGRSTSDVSEKQYEKMRVKLRQMKVPLKKWMDVNLKQELLEFDPTNLKKSPRKVTRRSMSIKSLNRSTAKSPLKLTIPRRNTVNVPEGDFSVPDSLCLDPDSLMTPDTFIVSRLEEISEEIMMDYPDLLQKPISDLLMPLSNNKNISYDAFKSVAKSVFDLELARVTPTVWSRVALTLYMVKETMFLGNLNDTQLELLVDYSTKFLKSNAKDDIEKQGGWDSLDLDDDSMIWAGAYDAISTDDDEYETKKQRKISRKEMYRKASFREQVSQTVAEWSPIGMAAMLVAIGIAYSYVKT